jgi:hypothetical protein
MYSDDSGDVDDGVDGDDGVERDDGDDVVHDAGVDVNVNVDWWSCMYVSLPL